MPENAKKIDSLLGEVANYEYEMMIEAEIQEMGFKNAEEYEFYLKTRTE